MVSICGGDQTRQQICKWLVDDGVNTDGVINTPNRPGIAKVRMVGLAQHRHPQHLIRLDFEDPSPIDSSLADRVIAALEKALDGAAALCVEDYNKGLLTPELCKRAIAIGKSKNIPVFVDLYLLADY